MRRSSNRAGEVTCTWVIDAIEGLGISTGMCIYCVIILSGGGSHAAKSVRFISCFGMFLLRCT